MADLQRRRCPHIRLLSGAHHPCIRTDCKALRCGLPAARGKVRIGTQGPPGLSRPTPLAAGRNDPSRSLLTRYARKACRGIQVPMVCLFQYDNGMRAGTCVKSKGVGLQHPVVPNRGGNQRQAKTLPFVFISTFYMHEARTTTGPWGSEVAVALAKEPKNRGIEEPRNGRTEKSPKDHSVTQSITEHALSFTEL